MNRPIFETYWEVDGQQIFDQREAERLVVEGGKLAREVSAKEQAQRWELRQAQERWHRQALENHAKHLAEQQYTNSPDGKAAEVRRQAAANGGGIVTVTSQDAALAELDSFGPDATNVFK